MDKAIMWIMAAGAIAGGLDRLFGNRLGLEERFEAGFHLLGATALSMAGIICLTPVLSAGLEKAVVPLWHWLGLEPAVLGGILAIDMGGYQLSMALADSPAIGRYAGIIVAAMLGCTITFTIPVGMGMLKQEDRPVFAQGILIGLGIMPVALVTGGLLCGLSLTAVLLHSLPVFVLSLLLMAGIRRFPRGMIRGFSVFAGIIRALTTLGLIAGAVRFMTGWSMISGLAPLEDAMAVVSSIGIVMLGSLPVAELLQRILRKPLALAGAKTGLNSSSITGLLIGIVSVVPAIAMIKDMDARGKVVNASFMVCAASALAAHMGFTFGVENTLVLPLLISKLLGGMAGIIAALLLTKNRTESPSCPQ